MSTDKMLSNEQIKEMILAAGGDLAPDLVLKNARIVNVRFTAPTPIVPASEAISLPSPKIMSKMRGA